MPEQDRTEELEIRMAWYERQLAELDAVVRELAEEVLRLRRELSTLQEAAAPEIGPSNEPPPHY